MSAGNGKQRKQQRFRRGHRWLGKTIVLFVVLLALSGIALNHGDAMGLDRRYVSWSWVLDAYGLDVPVPTASFAGGDRRVTLLGERLFLDGEEVDEPLRSLSGAVAIGPLLVIGGRTRVLVLMASGELVEAMDLGPQLAGQIERVGRTQDRVILEAGGALYRSDADVAFFEAWDGPATDPIDWSSASSPGDDELALIEAAYRGRGVTVERVLLDLHSGRIFGLFGKLFLDFIAIVLIVLSVSGLVLARLRARIGGK